MNLGARRGFWTWHEELDSVNACFVGRRVVTAGEDGSRAPGVVLPGREQTLRALVPSGVSPAWLEQVHSATVVSARPGANAPGDALVTRRAGLALAVVTADCVPVLLAERARRHPLLASVHAGWRGLARRILSAALLRFKAPAENVTAWIGPAIGPCCYEVGDDVAAEVVAASSPEVARAGLRGRPHLDLVAAARFQLSEHGVGDIRHVSACTRCDVERLASYRRDGQKSGRNFAVIWRSPG